MLSGLLTKLFVSGCSSRLYWSPSFANSFDGAGGSEICRSSKPAQRIVAWSRSGIGLENIPCAVLRDAKALARLASSCTARVNCFFGARNRKNIKTNLRPSSGSDPLVTSPAWHVLDRLHIRNYVSNQRFVCKTLFGLVGFKHLIRVTWLTINLNAKFADLSRYRPKNNFNGPISILVKMVGPDGPLKCKFCFSSNM